LQGIDMSTNDGSDRELTDVTAAVRSLAEIMQSTGLAKIEVEVGEISIRLQSGGSKKVSVPEHTHSEVRATVAPAEPAPVEGVVITAPMIGTYYTSPAPGAPAFVRVGERIESGQVIGIIEAMKIMNEIPAEQGGVVVELLATNAQAVEYGSPLLRIILDEADE
jgi:acetyl-CoA carboxylase biotin carboxyl carrier protein